ncbi:carboxypeptidase regulatory-like domain-containing protein [Candidatus Bathyarchaeota archaeon]|nr:carboxypeptidase regulatory-like domain-containing protein [Candidatus Bathyarchaeota archaeon]
MLIIVGAQASDLGNVHGTVVDENGSPLSDVKVTGYSSTGSFDSTDYTDGDGYFRLALYKGRNEIYLEKEGYVTGHYSITLPHSVLYTDDYQDPVKMGEIILEQNLGLTTSVLSRVVTPGETASFSFTVSVDDEPEEIEFHVNSPEGWDTRVLDSSSEIRTIMLNSGSVSLTLEVYVPETAVETETVSLTVVGTLNSTLRFTILPYQILDRDIQMASTYPYVSEELGRTISFPLTISNEGEADETVDLLGAVPEGWTTRFITSGGTEVLSLFLESGDSETLTLEVVPPEDASVGEYLVKAQAVSDEGILRDYIDLRLRLSEAEGEVKVLSSYTDVTVEAGNLFENPLTIWNKGDEDELFLITVMSVPAGWETAFKSGDIEISSLLVPAGSSAGLTFEVTPPEDSEEGSYNLIVFLESESGRVTDTLILGVDIREATSDVEIVSTFTDLTVKAGSVIKYPLRISNKGKKDDQLRMKVVSAPLNWDAVFTSDGNTVSSFYIAAGDYLSLNLEVDPPSNVETGEYSIVIQAESKDGTLSDEIELSATVTGAYEVELTLSTLYTTITIGDSVEFTVEVTNMGHSPLTSLYLDAAVPDDWDVTSTPSQVASLDPRESARFTIVTETPTDTVAGDYLITVQALSDQAESAEADLRVTAKASTSWGFIGIGLALVILIGLVVAFTRFKRR